MMLESTRYDKWDRERDRGGGTGGGGGGASAWAGRDRERDRERERQARAHQMSHAYPPEPEASASLFPAPIKLVGNRDRTSQQIQNKLGDYHLAQPLLEDPSKSIGICAEPQSPAPCLPSRREGEFKKPAHAPQNGRVHHRPYNNMYNKSDGPSNTGSSSLRPPPLRIPNGYQPQSVSDSSQPPIEYILKEMKSLPNLVSVIAATPRKEIDNKFIFNPDTNKVQENPQLLNNDLKTPLPKPGLDNRISNSRSSVSPHVTQEKDLILSESDDDGAATSTGLEPLVSPIGSGASPSSGSSSPSDSESESSSAESTPQPPASDGPARTDEAQSAPTQRSSWCLSNFAPPAPANAPDQNYDSGKELRNALADGKGKPSPISELSDSEASSPSPSASRQRRRVAHRASTASSDDDAPRHNASSPQAPAPLKRGRPPNPRSQEERPAKKKRGRPRKERPPSPAPAEPVHMLHESKTHIFRKVFTPKKGDEGGGKGGKGGKGKGGKGKPQVVVIEATAPETNADEDRRRNQQAQARVSPPHEETRRKEEVERSDHRRSDERIPRIPSDRVSTERIPTERTSNDRIPERMSIDRKPDRMDRLSTDRLMAERLSDRRSTERISEKTKSSHDRLDKSQERLSSEKLSHERLSSEKLSHDRLSSEKLTHDRLSSEKLSQDRLSSEKLSHDRLTSEMLSHDRLSGEKLSHDRLSGEKASHGRLPGEKMSIDLLGEKMSVERESRYVRAEADVGSGVKGRGSERSEEASSNLERRGRVGVRVSIPLSRLRSAARAALRRPPLPPPPPPPPQTGEVAATNHERTEPAGATPIYYSYFERLPNDAATDEERDHAYYLEEAVRLQAAAKVEQEPLSRVMLYLESVLCFVLTGRVLELEMDTKRAFNIYRETIELIKSIHSMPQRFRASPHSTFNKLDILSMRVQALLYLRMFKMYKGEVKEYNKIIQEYQQKACAESASPLSPAGGAASGAAGALCLAPAAAVPAHAHTALLQLTKYYTFLYVAHDLWEQADMLCRLRTNQDLFISVDRKCGPLTLFSTFKHLVQYVRYAISLLKNAPRE